MTATPCTACGAHERRQAFYTAAAVPTNSVRLIADRADALTVPRGDIRLERCPACGFIGNGAFDEGRVDYSPGYESTQSHSATFNRFHRALARTLVRRHGLHGGRVLEIGCGQGEFLALICAEGGGTGIGCDPAFLSSPADAAAGPVRVVAARYEDMPTEPADLVCCKMMLEHVAGPGALMALVRSRQGDGARLFVQVPNARSIFRMAAFWDVYYEHCNYFDAAALDALLAHAGFRVDRLAEAYGGQYLVAEAVAVDHPPAPRPRDRTEERAVRSFAARTEQRIGEWREWLADLARHGRTAVLWGGSSKAVAFLAAVGPVPAIGAVVDINPRKDGTFIAGSGHPVLGPARLPALAPSAVVVMNPNYLGEVRARLDGLGLRPAIGSVDRGPPRTAA